MSVRILPALCLLVLGLASSLLVAITETLSGDWVLHAGISVFAAGLLAAIAWGQKWTHFAWMPLIGFAVGSVGFVAGQGTLSTVGFLMFAVLTIWHGHQKEGKGRLRPSRAAA